MSNPVGFAVKEERRTAKIKEILSALPGGLQKYYPNIIQNNSPMIKTNNEVTSFAYTLKTIAKKY